MVCILGSSFRYLIAIGLCQGNKEVLVFVNIDLFSSLKIGFHFENGNSILLEAISIK